MYEINGDLLGSCRDENHREVLKSYRQVRNFQCGHSLTRPFSSGCWHYSESFSGFCVYGYVLRGYFPHLRHLDPPGLLEHFAESFTVNIILDFETRRNTFRQAREAFHYDGVGVGLDPIFF